MSAATNPPVMNPEPTPGVPSVPPQARRWIAATVRGNALARVPDVRPETLAGVLAQEFFLYDRELRTTPLAWAAVALVAAVLVGVMVLAVWLAVSRRNPANLSEAARVRCVDQ